MAETKRAEKVSLWLGILVSSISVLAFFGIANLGELEKSFETHDASLPTAADTEASGRIGTCLAFGSSTIGRLGLKPGIHDVHDEGCAWWPPGSGSEGFIGIKYETHALPETADQKPGKDVPGELIAPDSYGECKVDWPTSFGYVELDFGGSCSTAVQLAKEAYLNLSG